MGADLDKSGLILSHLLVNIGDVVLKGGNRPVRADGLKRHGCCWLQYLRQFVDRSCFVVVAVDCEQILVVRFLDCNCKAHVESDVSNASSLNIKDFALCVGVTALVTFFRRIAFL